jgi:hypothetical protein
MTGDQELELIMPGAWVIISFKNTLKVPIFTLQTEKP